MLTIAMIIGTIGALGLMLARLEILADPFGDDD